MSRHRTRPAARSPRARGPLAALTVILLALTPISSGDDEGTGGRAAASAQPTSARSATPPSCAQRTLDRLDLPSRAGQLLMVGVAATDPVAGVGQLSGVPVGGVFLRGRSSAGAAAVGAAVAQVQAASALPLEVAVDQEGGLVQTLTGPGFDSIPTALAQGALPADTLRAAATSWAGQLRAAGITMDLAPVADTVPAGTGKVNPPIGASDRQYGSDPARVAAAVGTVVRALQDTGVAATAKHFPGLGRVERDTDTDTGATDPETSPTDPYLQPFAAAVDAGTAAVMASSATYPRLDPGRLAVFSPAVLGLLRGQLRFHGVVVTDDLGQAVAPSGVPVGQRAVDAVTAGVDLVLTVRTADAVPMSAALVDRATTNPAFAAQVGVSALRVLTLKERFGQLTC
jgi:beta-N-acetylhexosaminidase